MPYNHEADISRTYPIVPAKQMIINPGIRAELHEVAERNSLMNQIGHETLLDKMNVVAGGSAAALVGLGAETYEIITSIEAFTGTNESDRTSYRTPESADIAMKTAFSIYDYSTSELGEVAGAGIAKMQQNTPVLNTLVSIIGETILGGPEEGRDLQHFLAGVALMRVLHVTGSRLINS